jgi:C1A family cysteine protease
MPNINTETFLGGHCVVCVGYNTKYWIMRNSWGNNGYFYLPYDYLLNDNLATDMWCIIKI